MIQEEARVVSVEQGAAWVETQRKTACQACSVKNGCGTSVLAKLWPAHINQVRVLDKVGVRHGDRVLIAISDRALVKGSLLVYLLPLLLMFAGAFVGLAWANSFTIADSDIMVSAMALLGLGAGFVWLRRWSRLRGAGEEFQPVIVKRLSEPVMFPFCPTDKSIK